MASAEFLAGMAFNSASLGYVHAMAHQLGGFYNAAHGVCNAVLLPVVQKYNAKHLWREKWKKNKQHWKSGKNGERFQSALEQHVLIQLKWYHFYLEMCFAPQRRAIFHFSSGHMALHPQIIGKHSVSRLS